jgi:hypothetical protein
VGTAANITTSHLQETVSYIPLGGAHRAVLMRERKAIFYVMLVMGEHLCSSYETSLETRWTHKKHIPPDITFTALFHC